MNGNVCCYEVHVYYKIRNFAIFLFGIEVLKIPSEIFVAFSYVDNVALQVLILVGLILVGIYSGT